MILESEDKKEEETKEEEKADEKAEGKNRPRTCFKCVGLTCRFLTSFLAPKRKAEEKDEDEPAEKK